MLQEVSKKLTEKNIVPFQIHVNLLNVDYCGIGECLKVIWYPKYKYSKGTNVNLMYINWTKFEKIEEDEAELDNEKNADIVFKEENEFPQTDTSDEIITILKTHANTEGFALVTSRKDSIRATLLCYLHGRKKKEIRIIYMLSILY